MLVTALGAAAEHAHWDGRGGWWPIFPIIWFLFVAAAVTIFAVTARRRARQGGVRAGERRLAERFAAGEIDEQEYRGRLATLREIGRS